MRLNPKANTCTYTGIGRGTFTQTPEIGIGMRSNYCAVTPKSLSLAMLHFLLSFSVKNGSFAPLVSYLYEVINRTKCTRRNIYISKGKTRVKVDPNVRSPGMVRQATCKIPMEQCARFVFPRRLPRYTFVTRDGFRGAWRASSANLVQI